MNKGEQHEKAEENDEDNRTVEVASLKVLLAAVMNFDYPWMKRESKEPAEGEEKPKFKVNNKEIGTFESGSLKLAEEEMVWINKHFTLMQAARNNFVSHEKKEKKLGLIAEEAPQIEEAPKPNEKSLKML